MKNAHRVNVTSNRVEEEIYERQVSICRAFANPTRLRMLDLIAHHSRKGSELQHELGISTANMSQHLAVLKAAGIVVAHRDGKQIHCSLAMPEVKQACQLIRHVLRAQIRNGRKLAL
jgi:DNA-binding transcriptional ArsR family regulator